MEINISVYMSSIRPYRWLEINRMLLKTGLTFEIVVVGPIKPEFELPKEIKFYESHLKPMQCFHTSAIMCKGQTLLQMADDIIYQDGGIVKMYETAMSSDNVVATCAYHIGGQNFSSAQTISGQVNNPTNLPLLPVCGLFKREVYEKLSGIDKRFIGIMGELDLYMRMNISGYKTVFVDNFCNEDKQYQGRDHTSLLTRFWDIDRPKFNSLWPVNDILIRQDIVRSYENKDLLTVEQNYP